MTAKQDHLPPSYDIVLVGGGLMGLSFAGILAKHDLRIACIERFPLSTTLQEVFDGRTTALSLGSKKVLEAADIWSSIEKECCPIDEIRVADSNSPHYLHFDHKELGDEPFGWIIDNRFLRQALSKRLQETKQVDYLAPAQATNFEYTSGHIKILLDDGSEIKTQLLIGADGKESSVRAWAGLETKGWSYNQSAIVCTVSHELDHENIAVEHFFADGPFAILPMTDDEDGTHRSSVVWTVETKDVDHYINLSRKDFNLELQKRFSDHLGNVHQIGGRYAYPLSLQHAKQYTAPRTALIGEAAHKIHPIAGQGLNLGMRDVALLAELIVDFKRLGLDIGSSSLLETYEKRRRFDNTAMAVATDGLNKLFSNDIKPVAQLRALGLGTVQKIPPLKRFFMRQAMGLSQTKARTPKLLKGERL